MINVAIIGYGYWGAKLHEAFSKVINCKVIAAVDIDEERLKSVPLIRATDYKQILKDRTVDVVAIATPAETHYEIARDAIFAGKDCFVEKPFTLEYSQALILEEMARHHRKIVMVDHVLLYHHAAVEMIRAVKAGEIGDLCYIRGHRIGGKVRGVENVLWSLGPHDLSLIFELIDRPLVDLHARGGSYLKDPKIEDAVFVQLVFEGGIMVNLQFTWMDRFKERRLVVVGTEGTIVFDDLSKDFPLTFWPNREILELPEARPLDVACKHFIDSVIAGAQPRSNAASGAEVVKALEHLDLNIKGSIW